MSKIPKLIFIIPYRNRPQHKFFFSNYLHIIMQDSYLKDDYEVYFSHQYDTRSFNRGATKNIGFLAIKQKYPNDYKNITFVFNDIDTIPFSAIFDYETVPGIVKHFYGFDYSLGGIVALNGSDFEAINGFPNFWGWGMEDTILQNRCDKIGLKIDRSQFYKIGHPHILHLFDGVQRIINRTDPWKRTHDDGIDGIRTIHKLNYTIDLESSNSLDNVHVINTNNMFIINITTFMTRIKFEHEHYHKYDLREPPHKIMNPDKLTNINIDVVDNDWSNIPFYPTKKKKNEMIKQYGKNVAEEIIKYSYENSNDPTKEIIPPSQSPSPSPSVNYQIPKFNRAIPLNINKFSPNYAKHIGVKPRATSSATIRLGGVY